MIDTSDLVRNSSNVGLPDSRTQHQSLDRRMLFISQFVLCERAPEDVRIHFETGKNLFIYAWHVYRFHMVAEQHILATLEMAARLRLTVEGNAPPPRGLAKLLQTARANNLIANERLTRKHRWALERARWRHDVAAMENMCIEGLSECIIDYTNVQVDDDDLNVDLLSHFIDTLPKVRNMHAHGSESIYPSVGHTFEIVQELINQLFAYDT